MPRYNYVDADENSVTVMSPDGVPLKYPKAYLQGLGYEPGDRVAAPPIQTQIQVQPEMKPPPSFGERVNPGSDFNLKKSAGYDKLAAPAGVPVSDAGGDLGGFKDVPLVTDLGPAKEDQPKAAEPKDKEAPKPPPPGGNGMVRTQQQTTVQQGLHLAPDVAAGMENASSMRAEAIREREKTATERAYEEGQATAAYDQGIRDLNQRSEDAHAEMKMKAADEYGRLETAINERNKLRVDPGKIWDNDNARGMALISELLGGIGASLLGEDPNNTPAQRLIKQSVDASVERQRSDIDTADKRIDNSKNLIREWRERGLDDDRSTQAARMTRLAELESGLKSIASRYSAPEIHANATEALAAIEAEKAETKTKLQQLTQTKVSTTTMNAASEGGPGQTFKTLKDIQDFANSSPAVKEFVRARLAKDSFDSAIKAGADGTAVANFIAQGLDQKSFPPEFIQLLQKRSMFGQGGEFVREKFMGGYNPGFIKEIQQTLENAKASATVRVQPVFNTLRQSGVSPDLVVGGSSPEEDAAALGGVKRK